MYEQDGLILVAIRQALKNIKQAAKKTALCVGGNTLDLLKDNLVSLRAHPEDQNKTQDNYKSKLLITVLKHKDPNVYTIYLMCDVWGSGAYGQLTTIVWPWKIIPWGWYRHWSIDKSPKTNLPFYQPKKIAQDKTPHQHPYGTSSKTQASTVSPPSSIDENSDLETMFGSLGSNLFGP